MIGRRKTALVLNTAGIGLKTAPVGLVVFVKHFLSHKKRRAIKGKPESQLAYDEGLAIIRKFLLYASTHPVSELQHFTANHVPSPSWVVKQVVTIPNESIDEAARLLRIQLEQDPNGIELIGGRKWWTIRGRDLTAEWIETEIPCHQMKKDVIKRGPAPPERILFYVHESMQVEHISSAVSRRTATRWEAFQFETLECANFPAKIQRHARKLGARAFAPSYRLAPQYPFPCGLQDILASYLFLINPPPGAAHSAVDPAQIIVSGDSAGAGAVVSLLVMLRDLKLPLPAGATLISPWVDLAHSFPSVFEDDSGDYIPSAGFHYRPGIAWPPLKGNSIMVELAKGEGEVLLDDQIQMYCPNTLLSHPLVSPVNQGNLGGLPPMLVVGGSSELLRDEIIYIAHKAASPSSYPPSQATLQAYPYQKVKLETQYPPTLVHLSIFDNCAHVTPTLSITKPAKSAANFGIWALTAAQKKQDRLAHPNPDSSHSSSAASSLHHGHLHPKDAAAANAEEHEFDSDEESETSSIDSDDADKNFKPSDFVTVTGHEPAFVNHMVRERVSPAGKIRAMEPAEQLPGCVMSRDELGVPHLGPVRKWQKKRAEWDTKYHKDLEKYRGLREEDQRRTVQQGGFLEGRLKRASGEDPPLCALARWWDEKHALEAGDSVDDVGKRVNAALAMWSRISAMPDEEIVGDKKLEEAQAKQ
ncbi:hypothetical protein P7C70_g3202, partial [Phenoliferia sp. Uapishka_3]